MNSPIGRGATRVDARIAASMNIIDEAPIIFERSEDVNYAGVMLALPALLVNGLNKMFENYTKKTVNGYYGLKSILIFIAFSALLRIKSLEKIKNIEPGEFGKILGLDRIPEIKTLRKKIGEISENSQSQKLSGELSKNWLEQSSTTYATGILYIDGHVRVYYGKEKKLPKRYVSRERLCLPGVTDYWVNDILGQPYFYVTSTINTKITNILKKEIIPDLKKNIPNQPSELELKADEKKSRFTIVFDREGYDSNFFKELNRERIAFITYKKNVKAKWPESDFKESEITFACKEKVNIKIAEKEITLSKDLTVREIRKSSESGHQTSIITTNYELSKEKIAEFMFSRWSQENFFKYMEENYGINRLTEYSAEEIPATKETLNPAYREIEKKIKKENGVLTSLKIKLSSLTLKGLSEKKLDIEKFSIKNAILLENIEKQNQIISKLKEKRKVITKKIKISELPPTEKFVGLKSEKKTIIDLIKMICYRSEVSLTSIIKEYRPKDDSIKSFLKDLFKSMADILPDYDKKLLVVSIHNLSTDEHDNIARYLLKKLNDSETKFPDTEFTIFYKLVAD